MGDHLNTSGSVVHRLNSPETTENIPTKCAADTETSKKKKEKKDKMPLKWFSEALRSDSIDEYTLCKKIQNASDDVLKRMAKQYDWIRLVHIKCTANTRNVIYDALYSHVMSRRNLVQMIYCRFGIQMGSQQNPEFQKHFTDDKKREKNWDILGLKRAYRVFMTLPPSHLQELAVVTTTDKRESSVNGYSNSTAQGINLEYHEKQTEAETKENEHSGFYEAGDRLVGRNTFDIILIHEIGHNVDHACHQTAIYSQREDFRALSGWRQHGTCQSRALVDEICDCLNSPFSDKLTPEDQVIAKEVAHLMLRKRQDPDKNVLIPLIRQIDKSPDDDERCEFLAHQFIKSPLFGQIQDGYSEYAPWQYECFPGLKRQIHEGYENQYWFSYNNEARQDKYSTYQFREPCEEFAEMYAAFFSRGARKMRPEHAEWFRKNVSGASAFEKRQSGSLAA